MGGSIYLIVDRTQERRFEQEFEARQLTRATDLQERTERAAERGELDTAQREFGELATNEALLAAVFVTPDNRVVTTFVADGSGTLMTMRMSLPDAETRRAMLATRMARGMEASYARLERLSAWKAAS